MKADVIRIWIIEHVSFVFLAGWLLIWPGDSSAQEQCIECHRNQSPGIVSQWEESKHAVNDVTCISCHTAGQEDVDGFEHYGERISVIVSPNDCSVCHETEFNQQKGSHHAMAAEILGSLDNLLGEVVGGQPAVVVGCRQCHGSEVKVDETGHPTADSWPNTGMGRINPDGSRGSCSACHTRHAFSVEQARQPEACGKCHLGPDHPQIEVWNESKHGVLYHANREKMNLDSDEWVAGKDYFTGPTCSSCHMGAGGTEGVTHDVGQRISWTLRPPVSDKLNMIIYEDYFKEDLLGENAAMPSAGKMHETKSGEAKKVEAVLTWQDRRHKMGQVCTQCHAEPFVESFYTQYDNLVELYNEKFAKPARSIIQDLKEEGIISKADFDDHIEWVWYELWHHEGRRARHGASMMGPDYAWWHGLYEVSKHFYTEFIPELKEVAGEDRANELLEKYVYSQEGHLWHRDGVSPELRQKIKDFYQQRYKQ
jgi:hypothetical protein